MTAAQKVPWQELPLSAEDCAELWQMTKEHFLATVACRPGFPVRLTIKPATWKAGEVIEYRDANRAGRPARRRSSGSKSSASEGHGVR